MLFGIKRAGRDADSQHPMGYGKELYFWTFVVAIMIFGVGAGVSIYEGIEKIKHPEPVMKMDAPWNTDREQFSHCNVIYDEQENCFKMWYAVTGKSADDDVGVIVSTPAKVAGSERPSSIKPSTSACRPSSSRSPQPQAQRWPRRPRPSHPRSPTLGRSF